MSSGLAAPLAPAGIQASQASAPATSTDYFIDSRGDLYTVNPSTGVSHLVGTTSTVMFDIAFSPTGQLYGTDGNGRLYTINHKTAATTFVGEMQLGNGTVVTANALEFAADGTLYAAGQNGVYTITKGTGAAKQVMTLPSQYQSAGDIVFDKAGHLFLSTTSGKLLELDLKTQTIVKTIGTGIKDLYGLIENSNGTMYGFSKGRDAVYRINPATDTTTFVAHLTCTQGKPQGPYGASVLPPPTTQAPTDYIIDSQGNLYNVDPTTGISHLVGSTGRVLLDIAFSPGGTLYGTDGNGYLYKINPYTAVTTYAAEMRLGNGNLVMANALEFGSDGALYAAGQNFVYSIDPKTGAAQQILKLPSKDQSAGDLVVDGAGNLFLTTTSGKLLEVNLKTDAIEKVLATGIDDLYGLIENADGTFYGFSNSKDAVYHLDLADGTTQFVADLTCSKGGPNGVYGASVDG
jgi:streptogramin lyase